MLTRLKARFGLKNVSAEMLLFYAYKRFYQSLILPKPERQVVMPIFGCQRSGTSMMTRIFFRDLKARVYREGSKLSSNDVHNLRLNPLDSVRRTIKKNKAPIVVLKPIVESQQVLRFMQVFPETRALWMYRHYRDVASSSLKAFGSEVGISDIRPIVEKDPHNWRSEGMSAATRALITENYAADMNPYDAAALFWYSRNQLYFDQQLGSNPDVYLCRYEDLTSRPAATMRKIYEYLDQPYPGDDIIREVHAKSIGKGHDITFSPEIEQLCDDMLDRLGQTAVRV